MKVRIFTLKNFQLSHVFVRSNRWLRYGLLSLSCTFMAGCQSVATSQTHSSHQKVTIQRDHFGSPHIYADDSYGLFYGYGYAVATDRLFQMEMSKRTGQGTVAEVLGAEYLKYDIATHSRFDPEQIKQQLAQLSPEDRVIFDGYAAGFNNRIQEVLKNPALMPKEFIDYNFKPSIWHSEDIVMIWGGLILNRFFAASSEITNLDLLTQLQAEKGQTEGLKVYQQLRWLDDPSAPTIIEFKSKLPIAESENATLSRIHPISKQAAAHYLADSRMALGQGVIDGVPTASNAWLVKGEKTHEGHAVLYNGPQQGWYTPAITYSVSLHGAGYNLTGITPLGLPAILFGTNSQIAWGSTVGSLDTNDFYQLSLNPNNRKEYLYQGKYIPLEHRQVNIKVRGQPDHILDVYKSKQGFIHAWDEQNHLAYAQRRSWEGVEVETLLGWANAAKATNWDDFLKQASRVAASITWFYADIDNNIGVAALGRLPIRPITQNVQFPAQGDGSMEWQGFYDFSFNPKEYNPEKGYIVSWNNKAYADLRSDSSNFSYVDRVNELIAPLENQQKLTQQQIWQINQTGAWSDLNARYFMPAMIQAAQSPQASQAVKRLLPLLTAWDYQLRPDQKNQYYQGAAPVIMRAWLNQMIELVLKPNLSESIYNRYTDMLYPVDQDPRSTQPASAAKLIWNALQAEQSTVPQSIDFLQGQTSQTVVLTALENAVHDLEKHYHSNDPKDWKIPVATMGFSTKNSIGIPWADLAYQQKTMVYGNTGSASFQVVLDPKQVTMCSILAPGQSGFIDQNGQADAHFSDQLTLFQNYTCKKDTVNQRTTIHNH
ncbi:penicillin acylase family protein [Acinetobacter sp. SAAs470]|nr:MULTISPECIES: penicillin acylase family protein [unclassified Acinetobacter]WOE33091.1 penicillin acylase family protein [Acinetobacter sp. SAAs470]WOE39918.1 penicillin acylase family protein [Acinetobacter sp. SAAs474]